MSELPPWSWIALYSSLWTKEFQLPSIKIEDDLNSAPNSTVGQMPPILKIPFTCTSPEPESRARLLILKEFPLYLDTCCQKRLIWTSTTDSQDRHEWSPNFRCLQKWQLWRAANQQADSAAIWSPSYKCGAFYKQSHPWQILLMAHLYLHL